MTKDSFIFLMTTIEGKIKERDRFLDKIYGFCNDDIVNQLFCEFDIFQDYLTLIEEEVCQAVGLKKNLTESWLDYFVFDNECNFSEMEILKEGSPIPLQGWADVWDFYADLAKEE